MGKYLVTFNDRINDVEISGFKVMSDKEVETFEKLAESITWDFIYPLNNETELEFSDGYDLLSKIEFKELTNEEYKILNKLFNEGFGVFVSEEFLEELIGEEEDFLDEDEDDEEDGDLDDYRNNNDYDDDEEY